MITFSRTENQVNVKIESGIENRVFNLTIECGSIVYAELLDKHLTKMMRDKLEEIRNDAYNQGYDDKKARRPRGDWFPSNWSYRFKS